MIGVGRQTNDRRVTDDKQFTDNRLRRFSRKALIRDGAPLVGRSSNQARCESFSVVNFDQPKRAMTHRIGSVSGIHLL